MAKPRQMRRRCPALDRRALLCGLAAALAAGKPALTRAATTPGTFPDGGAILVGGPQDGTLSGWASRLVAVLLDGQPPGTKVHRHETGGADGVTGANQFEARVAPDGQTALLAPGDAALAWLAGDPRAHYDVAKWLPILAVVTPGIMCCRLPAAALKSGGKLRVAASTPAGADLPALLAIELLGQTVTPVFGVQDAVAARQALAAGVVDAVLVRGPDAAAQVAALGALGAAPLFGMGAPDDAGALRRDPLAPGLPTLPELAVQLHGAAPDGQLYAAWQACAAAADLQFALVLPVLAPAALVSLWRKAAARMAAAPELQAPAWRMLSAPGANAVLSAISVEAPTLLALRGWMAERLNWHPS